jgi:hypothetical protein
VVLVLAAALSPGSAAAASAPLVFSAPKQVDKSPPFTSGSTITGISCPSRKLCVAVNVSGDAVVSTNPGAGSAFGWRASHIDKVARIEALSCPSRSLCVAVDEGGGVLSSANPAGKGPWRRVVVDRGHDIVGISCPAKSLCVAADDAGNVLTSSAPHGGAGAWKRARIHTRPNDAGAVVSCASAELCMVAENLGPTETARQHYDIVSSTRPAGGARGWHSVRGAGKSLNVLALACRAPQLCVALTDDLSVVAATNPTGRTSAWHVTKGDGSQVSTSVACPSVSLCVLGDDNGNVAPSTTPTAGNWNPVTVDLQSDEIGNTIDAIACPSVNLCVGGDDFGNLLVSTQPTGAASAWKVFLVDGGSGLLEVACLSASLCVARDTAGKVLTSTNPAGGAAAWKAIPGLNIAPNLASFESTTLFDLTCPSVSLCVTTDGQKIVASTNPLGGAAAWDATGGLGSQINTLTCASPTLCVAIESHPKHGFVSVLSSTNPAGGTAAWKLTAPMVPFTEFTSDTSCPSVTLCVATSDVAIASTNPTGGSAAWKSANLALEVDDVSCPTVTLCVGVDNSGNPVTTTKPTDSSWKTTKLPRGEGLTYVTCATNSLCVGVGGSDVLTTTNPTGGARAWHLTHIRGTTGTRFVAASCASASFCVAVSSDGYVVVGRRPKRG